MAPRGSVQIPSRQSGGFVMRNLVPPEFQDLSRWPTADPNALDEAGRKELLRRTDAVRRYVRRVPIGEIELATGLHRTQLYRLLKRCLATHQDGRIQGFRALIPYARAKRYRRTKRVAPTTRTRAAGSSGAMTELLERFDGLTAFLRRKLSSRAVYFGARGELCGLHDVHMEFLDACRQHGLTAADYPLNQERKGIRSLATAVRELAAQSFTTASRAAGATQIARPWTEHAGFGRPIPSKPYDIVEFDGHKVDIRLTIRFQDEAGVIEHVALGRVWLLVIIDVYSRAVLGWNLVLAAEYNRHDVMRTVQQALSPQRSRSHYSIPGLAPSSSAGFVAERAPYLAGACWERLRVDNAKANLAAESLSLLETVVGCLIEAGPVRQPTERPFVERFFGTIEAHLGHRLPATTGSHPRDVRRRLTNPNDRDSLPVSFDELLELMEVTIANYNGTPHDGIGARAPNEFLISTMQLHRDTVRVLSEPFRRQLCLLQPWQMCTVRGSLIRGVRPYINLQGVRYSSAALQKAPDLMGKELRVYFDPQDLTLVQAYLSDGAEFGPLNAARPWHRTKHSLRLRQEIQRLRRQRKLHFSDSDDPLQAFLAFKRKEAARGKKATHSTAEAARTLSHTAAVSLSLGDAPPTKTPPPFLPPAKARPLLHIGKGQVTKKGTL